MVGKVWDTENKFKLLLTIIEILDPKALPWGEIAAAMGEGYTVESVKQQYSKGIKKGFKSGGATDANGNRNGTPTSAKSTKTPATKGTGKGRKRKAVTPAVAEDDDEEATVLLAKKSRKIKHEDAAEGEGIDPAVDTLGAEVFKADEDCEGGVGLKHNK
ncbi:hypothetical protein OEA41_009385 [Lepraria neglecta]|uniref:Myb-like domain-containing protein n=1 Tax=Lepraria neglecta TaxID=209136 RepID=A0AAD9Z1Q2_9LECA|nr:hypothetical protein OEA41_009385 [Lepraria neglecta]